MTTAEYEQHVTFHAKPDLDLNYAVIAINGEAGEIAEWYKKVVLRGRPQGLTDQDLQDELGDVLYYLTRMAMLKGWSLETVMARNKEKLDARHGRKS